MDNGTRQGGDPLGDSPEPMRRRVNDQAGDVQFFEPSAPQNFGPGGPATSWYIQTMNP